MSKRHTTAIGIIGGTDGPTAIYTTGLLSPVLLFVLRPLFQLYFALRHRLERRIIRGAERHAANEARGERPLHVLGICAAAAALILAGAALVFSQKGRTDN